MPEGFRHLATTRRVGTGRDWFEVAGERLLTWDVQRRAGLVVTTSAERVVEGATAVLGIGFGGVRLPAPIRVVYVVDEPTVRGFAYGTLPGHPESGEELFSVHLEPDGTVRGEIRAFSRPGSWLTRVGGPLARRVQDRMTERYLKALTADPDLDGPAAGHS